MATGKWLEIINVRLSNPGNQQAVLDIFDQIKAGMPGMPCQPRLSELYTQKKIQTDWSIILHWQRQTLDPSRTRIGLSIAEEFRGLGLVNHAVWIKDESKGEKHHVD